MDDLYTVLILFFFYSGKFDSYSFQTSALYRRSAGVSTLLNTSLNTV